MKVNFANSGVFFPWQGQKGKDKTGVTVRPLTTEKRAEIDSETVTEEKEYYGGLIYRDRQVDSARRMELIYDYCIVSWSGLQDEEEKEYPCTSENKLAVMRRDPALGPYIAGCMEKAERAMIKQAETERKN